MTSYKNLAGNVGICSYEIGEDNIRIKFHNFNKKSVVYDANNTVDEQLEQLKSLAFKGVGLNHYITEHLD